MKTGVAIALIIVGGVLILGPLVADCFNQTQHQANAMKVVETTKKMRRMVRISTSETIMMEGARLFRTAKFILS